MAIDIDKALKNLAERRGTTVEAMMAGTPMKSRMASLRKRRYGGVPGFDANGNVVSEIQARMSLLARDREDPEEKTASAVAKGLLSGLLGVGDFTPEILARQAGKGVRRAVVPVGAAGGAAALVKKQEHHEDKEEHHEKAASGGHKTLLGVTALGALGSVGSAVGANRAASTREKELAFRRGLEKKATTFSIPHGDGAPGIMDKLRRLLGKPAIAKK